MRLINSEAAHTVLSGASSVCLQAKGSLFVVRGFWRELQQQAVPEEGLGGVAWFQYWLKLPPAPFYVAERGERCRP